jgi:RHS repeat-associated protein
LQAGSYVLKGTVDSYHGTGSATGRAGMPKQFTKVGWLPETYEWYATGLIKKRTFKNFNWSYDYLDGKGLVSKVTNPDGQFTEYAYDKLMRLKETKDRSGNVKTVYDYTYPTLNAGLITAFGNVKATSTFTPVAGSGLGIQETFQYFDGLGRGIETVYKGKANGKDQVQALAYDNQGRVSKTFETYASGASTGEFVSTPGNADHYLTDYEANSLNRVSKQTPASWAATITTYGSNNAGDGVQNINFPNGSSAAFAVGSLRKTTVTDGNGNKSITFKDKKGRIVLSRRANGNESSKSDTYYVYDDKDRLAKVIPPGAVWGDANLTFGYLYLGNDLVSQKKLPGKGAELFEYNSRDLPVKFQDPFLLANSSRWMGSNYDDYGRLTIKGVYASGSGDGIVLSNKIIENIYGASGIEIDKLKTSKTILFGATTDPVATLGTGLGTLQKTFSYDSYGRVTGYTGNNHTALANNAAENLSYTYDFQDNILSETRNSTNNGGSISVANTRQFDAWGRLAQTGQSINGAAATIISRLSYTNKDQLAWKKLGPGANGLQQVDYDYQQNGMLKSINGVLELTNSSFETAKMLQNLNLPIFSTATTEDLFRQKIEYNVLSPNIGGTAQSNGNIGQLLWQVKGRTTQAYGFTYDYLDRLTNAKYTSFKPDASADPIDYFGESQTYDARGNILSIKRNGMVLDAAKYINKAIDNQTVTIPSASNQMSQSIGASSIDPTKLNLDSPHNHLNLPAKWDFGSNNIIEFWYDGLGTKLRKIVKVNNVVALTHDYLGAVEVKNNATEAVYNEEGRAFMNAGAFRYEYLLRDHLGNTRVSFTDKNGNGVINSEAEILQENHYYPFGKSMEGAWYKDASASKYRYLYNGKELTDEFNLNFYDYGARWLDPGMASWWEVDPLGEKMPAWSPYSYGFNNPIRFVDPTGLIPSTHTDGDGNVVAVYDDGDLGVYKHDGTMKEAQKAVKESYSRGNTSAGGEKMGESLHSLSFANQSRYNESGVVSAANMKIDFGSTALTDRVQGIINSDPSVIDYFNRAGTGGDWDIKRHVSNGSLLYGKYASPRDAGNFAAGAVAQSSGMEPIVQYGFGAYNLTGNSKPLTVALTAGVVLLTRISPALGLGSAYLIGKYGEDKLSQRSINIGKDFIRTKR